jgi:hypothetical protein
VLGKTLRFGIGYHHRSDTPQFLVVDTKCFGKEKMSATHETRIRMAIIRIDSLPYYLIEAKPLPNREKKFQDIEKGSEYGTYFRYLQLLQTNRLTCQCMQGKFSIFFKNEKIIYHSWSGEG